MNAMEGLKCLSIDMNVFSRHVLNRKLSFKQVTKTDQAEQMPRFI